MIDEARDRVVAVSAGAFESAGGVCLLPSGLMFIPYDRRCRDGNTVNL